MAFAELLGRSCFSFLRGASQPEDLVERAAQLGLSAIAIADRLGLYGSVRAHARAAELGQPLLVGAELVVAPRGRPLPSEAPAVVLLVRDQGGYSNLCRLLTRCHAGVEKGQGALEPEWLGEHAAGLVAIVPAPRDPEGPEAPPAKLLGQVRDAFGERAWLGVHRHLEPGDRARIEAVERAAERYGFEIVASAAPLVHDASRRLLADVLCCIREGTTLDRAGTLLLGNAEARLRSEAEMLRLFKQRPAWVGRSAELASELRFSLAEVRYRFPCALEPGQSADERLAALTWAGAARRYPGGVPEKVALQLAKELRLIAELEVAAYFLSTWEVVEIARARRILCQGRGSAANSAVCYALGITAVDPARSNLLFERFMSQERREPPDIDIDFEHERREEVIQEIYARHGRDRAAMVSEVICYRGKSALREVGKAFGLSLDQVEKLAATITHWDSAEVSAGRLAELGFDSDDERLGRVVALARQLEGLPRHLSIHVGGFVLSAEPLWAVAPVEPARMAERTVLPWDKDDIETLGFFKIDVLGLGMLTAVRKALEAIHRDGGLRAAEGGADEAFDPLEVVTRVPAEDPATYELMCRADTVGVFQIESRAQMAMLPRLLPRKFYDLVVEVAIVRPGPIQGGMVHPYLRRRSGREPVDCPHPELWPILERTLGVPLFQEQVMQIAIVGAGYSGGQADQLRRDMAAWKKHGKLLQHRERLLEGFSSKGIPRRFGEALFEQIKGFGEYGFPESHAASFALIVYASAWQKAHYPAHFACALVNSQPMGFYSPSALLQDVQRHGVEVRDVSIAESDWDCTLEPAGPDCRVESTAPGARRAIRLGLRLIKGFGRATAERIVAARREGAFSELGALVRRAGLRRDELERLAEAGALEPLVAGRRNALWRARAPRVCGLFRELEPVETAVELPPLGAAEQLVLDYGHKGLSVHDHPLRHLRARLAQRGVVTASELVNVAHRTPVAVAGLVTCRQQPATASGVVFITLEDETGCVNLVLWRRVYEQWRLIARHASLLLARGRVEREPREVTTQTVAVIHVIVEQLERVDSGRRLVASRDFH
ncbi:MAG: error-prone DNA polymerase [Polyangiaceae bacterium]|nr:error-prone DNA polymerase [Polyangiaceae bacterium]